MFSFFNSQNSNQQNIFELELEKDLKEIYTYSQKINTNKIHFQIKEFHLQQRRPFIRSVVLALIVSFFFVDQQLKPQCFAVDKDNDLQLFQLCIMLEALRKYLLGAIGVSIGIGFSNNLARYYYRKKQEYTDPVLSVLYKKIRQKFIASSINTITQDEGMYGLSLCPITQQRIVLACEAHLQEKTVDGDWRERTVLCDYSVVCPDLNHRFQSFPLPNLMILSYRLLDEFNDDHYKNIKKIIHPEIKVIADRSLMSNLEN